MPILDILMSPFLVLGVSVEYFDILNTTVIVATFCGSPVINGLRPEFKVYQWVYKPEPEHE